MVSWWWAGILGFIIALSIMEIAARYVSLFLMAFLYVGESLAFTRVGHRAYYNTKASQ
jgi:hypothetical protein